MHHTPQYEYQLSSPKGPPAPLLTSSLAPVFTGLQPGTAYTLRVVGLVQASQRKAGANVLTFTTPAAAAKPLSLSLSAAIGPTSAGATAVPGPGAKFARVSGGWTK